MCHILFAKTGPYECKGKSTLHQYSNVKSINKLLRRGYSSLFCLYSAWLFSFSYM